MPKTIAEKMHHLAGGIHYKDLNGEFAKGWAGASAGDGIEMDPHVTVKWGLHTSDPEEVKKLLAHEPPIKLTIGRSSLFETEEGDVLKMGIHSPDLHRLNEKLGTLAHTSTHPEYVPHSTIAYLQKGAGKKYEGDKSLDGETITVDKVTFSGKDGRTTEIALGGKPKDTEAAPAEESNA